MSASARRRYVQPSPLPRVPYDDRQRALATDGGGVGIGVGISALLLYLVAGLLFADWSLTEFFAPLYLVLYAVVGGIEYHLFR